MNRGEIWMADLPEPTGSEAGFFRPVVIVQHDEATRSRLGTVVSVQLTSQTSHSSKRWTLPLPADKTGLRLDSVALLYLVTAVARGRFGERVGCLDGSLMQDLDLALMGTLDLLG